MASSRTKIRNACGSSAAPLPTVRTLSTTDDAIDKDALAAGGDADAENSKPRVMDLIVRFYDNYTRTFDSLKKSLEAQLQKTDEQDAAVNYGVGHVEDRRLTHGISQGATITGVYGTVDLLCNQNTQEYLLINKLGEIHRYDWAGKALPPLKPPPKKFSKFLYIKETSNYILWTPRKSGFYITKEDLAVVIDSVSVAPIGTIIYGDRRTEEGVDFFIISECSLIKYSYQPANNVISLQDVLKISDIEADNAVIEQYCFDQPQDDKKQWIYLTFKRNCTIIDVTGRIHGTKKNLHDHRITAVVASGSSEFVVTGDEKGLLKMWGSRWSFLTSIQPHTARVTHLLEHPGGQAVISISRDQILFSWSFISKEKLESMTAPEIVERLARNPDKKGFMTQGPRKLVIWRMDDLFVPHCLLSAPLRHLELTWNPEFPTRAIAISEDNAVRLINPASDLFHVLVEEGNNSDCLDIMHYDGNVNPCKLRDTWKDGQWDLGISAIALYDYVASHVIQEKEMSFSLHRNKKPQFTGKATFFIAGRLDGCLCKLDIRTGAMGYYAPCHKGHVSSIILNVELNQFISAGTEPGIRLWKINLTQEEEFVPLVDITWKFPIRHITFARELIGFALTHAEATTHKLVLFNNLEGERYDHRTHFAHTKPIISISGSRELVMFCTASLDETIRIWSEKNDLIRVLFLNWTPTFATFGTKQGDIFVGIKNMINLIPANKYLTIIYRNRAILSELNAGTIEDPVTLNVAKSGQDPRMYVALEGVDDSSSKDRKDNNSEWGEKSEKIHYEKSQSKIKIKIPTVTAFNEPRDSQRARDFEFLRFRFEDLMQIVEGNHPLSTAIPDPHNMTKQQWDEFGKSVFGDDEDRKFFVSESRQACINKMNENNALIENVD